MTNVTEQEFAYSQSAKAYGVVHRTRGVDRAGRPLAFCSGRPIFDERIVRTIGELRGHRLCSKCFRLSERG
jgi:hypothetical protein